MRFLEMPAECWAARTEGRVVVLEVLRGSSLSVDSMFMLGDVARRAARECFEIAVEGWLAGLC